MASLTIPEVEAIQTTLNAIKYKRARLLKGLFLLLETITKARGYVHSVDEVSFNVKSWRDKSRMQTPVIYIIDDRTDIKRKAGRTCWEYTWSIPLFCVVRDDDIFDLENFIGDVETAIYDNNSLFGNVSKMEVVTIITDNQLFSEIDGVHLAEITVDLEYVRDARSAL